MKMIYVYLILSLLLLIGTLGCKKTQKVIFEVQSYSFRNKDSFDSSRIEEECAKLNDSLSKYMSTGWKVVSSSPNERVVYYDKGTCIGTEYIIEK